MIIPFYNGEAHVEYLEKARGGHTYRWIEKDKFLPGPTSVLPEIWAQVWKAPWMKKLSCAYFRAQCEAGRTDYDAIEKEAKSEDRRVSKEATDIGSLVHKFCEEYPGGQMPEDAQARAACEAFKRWHYQHDVDAIEKEKVIFSRSLCYAGKFDLLATIDGELCILDYKTSKVFAEENPAQLAAYAVAHQENTGEKIAHGWIIRLDKLTGEVDPHYVPLTDELKRSWVNGVQWYWSRKNILNLSERIKEATAKGTKVCQTSPSTSLAVEL